MLQALETNREQYFDFLDLLLLDRYVVVGLLLLSLLLRLLPLIRLALGSIAGMVAAATGRRFPMVEALGALDLEQRAALRVIVCRVRLPAVRYEERRYGAAAQPIARRVSGAVVLDVPLVRVLGEVEGADARGLDVERRLAVGEGSAVARHHPSVAHFLRLGESMVADTVSAGTAMTVTARRHGALRHPKPALLSS